MSDYDPNATPAPVPTDAPAQTQYQSVGTTLLSSNPAPVHAPTVIDVPLVYQDGGNLICTMGNWTDEPTDYAYQWRAMLTVDEWAEVDGAVADTYLVVPEMVGKTVACMVTAKNDRGFTKVLSNPLIVIAPVV